MASAKEVAIPLDFKDAPMITLHTARIELLRRTTFRNHKWWAAWRYYGGKGWVWDFSVYTLDFLHDSAQARGRWATLAIKH